MNTLFTITTALCLCAVTGMAQLTERKTILKTTAIGFTESAEVIGKKRMQINGLGTYEIDQSSQLWLGEETTSRVTHWGGSADATYGLSNRFALIGQVEFSGFSYSFNEEKGNTDRHLSVGLGGKYQLFTQKGALPSTVLSASVFMHPEWEWSMRLKAAFQYDFGVHWDVRGLGTLTTLAHENPLMTAGVNVFYHMHASWSLFTGVEYRFQIPQENYAHLDDQIRYQVGAGYHVGEKWLITGYIGSSAYVHSESGQYRDYFFQGGLKLSWVIGK